jgi:dihydrofolate reductase
MRRLTYYIALSLDGYIAGPADEVDFYPQPDPYVAWMAQRYPETLPTHIRAAVGASEAPNKTFDTIVMGRRTYQPALDAGITSPYGHLRQYVVSSTQEAVDPDVTIVRGDPVTLVRELKAEDSPMDIYLAGGGRLAGALLEEIDRVVLKLYPVVAGSGIPAFGDAAFQPTRFDLVDTQTFEGGNAVLTYDRLR